MKGSNFNRINLNLMNSSNSAIDGHKVREKYNQDLSKILKIRYSFKTIYKLKQVKEETNRVSKKIKSAYNPRIEIFYQQRII